MPTVLIVDDNQKVIDMLRRTLIYEGYEVLVAPAAFGLIPPPKAKTPY